VRLGIGISIAVNRNPACRCALVSEPLSAALAASTMTRTCSPWAGGWWGRKWPRACLDAFLATPFLGDRHQRRVDQLSNPVSLQEPA
jgi:ribose 5-phosphate isomerase B